MQLTLFFTKMMQFVCLMVNFDLINIEKNIMKKTYLCCECPQVIFYQGSMLTHGYLYGNQFWLGVVVYDLYLNLRELVLTACNARVCTSVCFGYDR